MRSLLTAVLPLALSSPAALVAQRAGPPPALALRHVNVVDVERGRVVPDQTVLLAGGRIRGVAPSAGSGVPAGVRTVEGAGAYLIPGLRDMHVHVASDAAEPPFEPFVAYGVTAIRDVGGSLSHLRLLQQRFATGAQLGPRVFFCGPELDGNPPASRWISIIVDTPARARSAVRFLADQGASCLKAYERIEVEPLAAVIDEARQRRLPVTVHPSRTATMRRAAELGARGLEHLHLGRGDIAGVGLAPALDTLRLWDRQALLWQQVDVSSAAARDLVAVLAARGVFLTPTLTTDEGNNLIADAEQAASPENEILPPEALARWKSEAKSTVPNVAPDLRSAARTGVLQRRRFVKAAADAGVTILAGTGGPWLGTYLPGLATHHELALLVEAGLTPLDALRAATLNPARFFAATDSLGSVAVGKLADLVLLDANPLADPRNLRKIRAVVLSGRYLDRGVLDGLLHHERGSTSLRGE